MNVALKAKPAPPVAIAKFPHFPPRDDMMNPRYLHAPAHQASLSRHLGNPDTTLVLGEVPIAWEVPLGRAGVRIPDLLIAFNVQSSQILEQHGYAISEHGKPPDFVLEVASNHTSRRDETQQWLDYANFGVTEYWLFDPDWGRRYARGLTGWTLVDGLYQPIPIRQYAAAMHYGRSAVLELQVCWEQGELRWYNPAARGYLDTFDSAADARDLAIQERDGAVRERDVVARERDVVIRERDGAIAEAQRLRDEIARLRGGRN